MATSALAFATIEELGPLLAKRKISPVDLTRLFLSRIESLNPQVNAFLSIRAEHALAEARVAERELLRGRHRGPLHGIPIALKDNIWTRGIRTTAGSAILRDFVPSEDATVARRLHLAGAVLLGKTNMHEFAYGITGENPHFGPTRNPWSTERISGGSSSGSAAAIAAGMCVASVGTDTGGSIRIPAAMCGIVGLKPTFGRVSRYGVVPLALSFDHVGPLARSGKDAALLMNIIAGSDPLDSTSAIQPREDFSRSSRVARGNSSLRKVRLGWPREYFWTQVDPEVRALGEAALKSLLKQGAELLEVSLPTLSSTVEPSNIMALAEARTFHEQAGYFPRRALEYGKDVRSRLSQGGDVRAVDYLLAREVIRASRGEFRAAFSEVDVIAAPATPIAAPLIGKETSQVDGVEESVRSALVRLNRPANFTGLPAISIPCGFTSRGLPVGLQLIGQPFKERTLLRITRAYEKEHNWARIHPQLTSVVGNR